MIKITILCAAGLGLASIARGELVTITFEADAPGAVPNGFTSSDSSLVSFSDTFGADLELGNFGIASIGNGLRVGGDDLDGSFLSMHFSAIADSLTIDLGGDNPGALYTIASLTLYLDGLQVGSTDLEMNGDGAINDTISFAGTFFNSATLDFYDGNGSPPEYVDNISFNVVPSPAAIAVFAIGVLHGRGRRRRA